MINHPEMLHIAMKDHKPPRLLGVYAHPDDETLCTGGTLAKYAAAGTEVMVVSVTQGEAGQIRDPSMATRSTLGSIRVRELHEACGQLGVQHVTCLDYQDGQLETLDNEVLVLVITEIIRTFQPDVVLTFGADGAYGHPDHIAVGTATTTAFMRAGDPAHYPEQIAAGLAPHPPTRLYHTCFPRQQGLLLDQLVQWLKSLDTRFRGSPDFIHGLTFIAEEATTLGYSRDHICVGWYPAGLAILEQGEPPFSLYMILSGCAEVLRQEPDGSMCKIGELGPGAFFGEDGLAALQPRNAYVVARDSVSCLVLSPDAPTAFAARGTTASGTEDHLPTQGEPLKKLI